MITNLLKKIYVNTEVMSQPGNTANFNPNVKMLKKLNFRYDTET